MRLSEIEDNPYFEFALISRDQSSMKIGTFYPKSDEISILKMPKSYFDRFFGDVMGAVRYFDKKVSQAVEGSRSQWIVDNNLRELSWNYEIIPGGLDGYDKFQQELDRYNAYLGKKRDAIGYIVSKHRSRTFLHAPTDLAGIKKYEEISALCTQPNERAKLVQTATGVYDWPGQIERDLNKIGRIKVKRPMVDSRIEGGR
jgi:hypothetical protein